MTEDSEEFKDPPARTKSQFVYNLSKDFGLPVIVLLVGLVVTYSQYAIEESRIERQEKIETARNQISILNNYCRSISDLIQATNLKDIRGDARQNASNHFCQVAPALTLSTLPQLDGAGKGNLIEYLIVLDLLRVEDAGYAPISLANADLSQAHLKDANLKDADLKNASLRDAELDGTNLSGADIFGADLRGALHLTPLQLMAARNWRDAVLDDAIGVATQERAADTETK